MKSCSTAAGDRVRSRRLPRSLAALGLLGLVVLVASCDMILGAHDYEVAPPPEDPPCGGFEFVAPECGGCVEASCCAEADACRGSSDCAALFDCLATCDARDGECRFTCKSLHATHHDAAAETFASCRTQKCTAACVGCGGIFEQLASTCDECMEREGHCCEQSLACATDPTCEPLAQTMLACTDPWCLMHHFGSGDGLPPALTDALTCAFTKCAIPCALGRKWSCLGEYGFQDEVPETVSFSLWAGHFTGAPTPNIEVKACSRNDLACLNPIDIQTTVDNFATLSVPGGFDGYFAIAGGGLFPVLYYHFHPLWFDMSAGLDMYPPEFLDAAFAPAVLDPELGALDIYIADCFGQPAPDVRFSVSPGEGTTPYYTVDMLPVLGPNETTGYGRGGFLNVQPGIVNVVATLVSTGQEVANTSAVVRAGMVTRLDVFPAD